MNKPFFNLILRHGNLWNSITNSSIYHCTTAFITVWEGYSTLLLCSSATINEIRILILIFSNRASISLDIWRRFQGGVNWAKYYLYGKLTTKIIWCKTLGAFENVMNDGLCGWGYIWGRILKRWTMSWMWKDRSW